MSNRLLGATLFLLSSVLVAGAQTSSPPARTTPGASPSPSGVSAATHCRDSSGAVKLKSAMSGSSSSTTGAAANTKPSSSPGTSSSVNSPSGMSGSTETAANLPPC